MDNFNLPDISSAKFISGIDQLVYAVIVDFENYSTFYNNILIKGYLSDLSSDFNRLSKSDDLYKVHYELTENKSFSSTDNEGFSPIVHKLKLCRLTFKNLTQKDNNYFLKIDVSSEAILLYGLSRAVEIINSKIVDVLGINIISTKVSRFDPNFYLMGYDLSFVDETVFSTRLKRSYLTKTCISEEDYLELDNLVSSFGTKSYMCGTRWQLAMRIYNKSKELLEKSLHFKSSLLDSRFMIKYNSDLDFGNIWQIEFEIGGDYLKIYDITTVEDVFLKVNFIFKDIAQTKIRMLEKRKGLKHNDRIKNHKVWDYIIENYQFENKETIEVDKIKLKQYKKDDNWILNRIDEYILEDCEKDFKSVYLEIGRRLGLL